MLDFVGLTLIILFFIRGYKKGIIVAVFSIFAIVLGLMIALKLSGWLGAWLLQQGLVQSGWGQLLSYALLFVGVILLVRLVAKALETALSLVALGWINGLIGGLIYSFLSALVWSSFLWIGNEMHLLSIATKTTSLTYNYFQPLAPWVFHHLGSILPMAKKIFADLHELFQQINQTIPDHVDTH